MISCSGPDTTRHQTRRGTERFTAKLIGVVALLAALASPAHAALVAADYKTAGDALLVRDTVTGLEWLRPSYTSGQSYNAVIGGYAGLVTTDHFTYATQAQVTSLLSQNFPTLPIVVSAAAGTAAGATAAQSFFALFGINTTPTCTGTPAGPCPRSWAITADAVGSSHYTIGVFELGAGTSNAKGYALTGNAYVNTLSGDPQMGSWLVRSTTSPVPLPAAAWLLLSGIGGLGALKTKRRRQLH
jgi:hypothetical protein